ncbi:MAG: hypothetical protein H7A24_04510 [Leptospiraceae bacterium]|nr:hypothetical protein [Leptospiraceae bacterium]MCP5511118.1 hypothetical protein [Leptospiraceae bacterium]
MLWIFLQPILSIEDEIQVYTDSMNAPGKYGVELHSNYVNEGSTKPEYRGELPTDHVTQAVTEFAYGLNKNFEAGLYFPPMALAPDGSIYENGIRFRIKFIGDSLLENRLFWGLNTEVGYSTKRVSDTSYNLEFRPIIGYKADDWLISFNPNMEAPLSGKSSMPDFDPCLKAGYYVKKGILLGFEEYLGLGPLNQMNSLRDAESLFFLATDISLEKLNLNFGVGRGNQNMRDKGVVKMIFTIPF